ncbi:MAG: hypothetical protein WC503_02785 [Candidatus Shapirobacteria bacterium]
MTAKNDLIIRIKRRLGWPSIKLEVEDETISQHIDFAKKKFIRYAVGQATQEVFFTVMLSAGQYLYDMPDGVTEIVSYNMDSGNLGGINTLFTISNALYEQGMFGILDPAQTQGYNLISYHAALDFLETLKRYTPEEFNYKYLSSRNVLEVQPPPTSGYALNVGDYTYDSPGWLLVRAYMLKDSTHSEYTDDFLNADLYNTSMWMEDYARALTKESLGLIRRKFASFSALGNQGTSLDGGDLLTEAKTEIEELEKSLREVETWEGGILFCG